MTAKILRRAVDHDVRAELQGWRRKGVANVLSIIRRAPFSCAIGARFDITNFQQRVRDRFRDQDCGLISRAFSRTAARSLKSTKKVLTPKLMRIVFSRLVVAP